MIIADVLDDLGLSHAAWRFDVANRETLLGYWHWVKGRLAEVEDELSRDCPF